jgi:intracellular septation protein A
VLYFAARPFTNSDTVALALAGALPLAYQVLVGVVSRRVDRWAVLSGISFVLACVVSALAGGSALPLKLPEAAVTFVLGLVLLVAALIRRPIPLGRLLKAPAADDATLGVLAGVFLILHALLHLALAIALPTSTYVVAGRLISWGTLAVGATVLWIYLRRIRATAAGAAS